MKKITDPVMANPVGAIVGGVAFWWGSHKYANVSNMYARIALTAVGVYVGAMAQKQVSAMMSKPTSSSVK